MDTIAERISLCIESLGLKRNEFAKRLDLSSPFVSELCSGRKAPSDRTIAAICREFHVREDWLRTGEGSMYTQLTPDQERAVFLASVTAGESSPEVNAFIDALKATPNGDLKTVIAFIGRTYEAYQENLKNDKSPDAD